MSAMRVVAEAPLKSCPFCGALEAELEVMDLGAGEGHAVVCDCCGATGPSDCRPGAARALWNGVGLLLRPSAGVAA